MWVGITQGMVLVSCGCGHLLTGRCFLDMEVDWLGMGAWLLGGRVVKKMSHYSRKHKSMQKRIVCSLWKPQQRLP